MRKKIDKELGILDTEIVDSPKANKKEPIVHTKIEQSKSKDN